MARKEDIEFIISTEFPSVAKYGDSLPMMEADGVVEQFIDYIVYHEGADGTALIGLRQRSIELESFNDAHLRTIAQEILDKQDFDEKERQWIKDEELLSQEEQLFGAPEMTADFPHFATLAYWNPYEAACLLLNKDPRRLPSPDSHTESPFSLQLRNLTERLSREAETGSIGNERRIIPSRLLLWARRKGVEVPEGLIGAVETMDLISQGGDLVPLNEAASTEEKSNRSLAELQNEIAKLKKERKQTKSANTRWRRSTLLIIYGLLHAGIKGAPRNCPASIREIENFLEQVLRKRFDEETIRQRLKEIEEMAEELQTDIYAEGRADARVKEQN
jgi:hypothetical protein